jgi:hypothetical protein
MPVVISHNDLENTYKFKKGAGGQWYNPKADANSDKHVHLVGTNSNPGYDPDKNPNAPGVLTVEKVEIKVDQTHRWWGDRQLNGTFLFKPAVITKWGVVNKAAANELLEKVPAPLK